MSGKQKKILMLVTDFGPPWTDGIKNSGKHVARRLAESGEVVCVGLSGRARSFESEGCRVEMVRSPFYDTAFRKVFMVFGVINLLLSIRKICHGFQPQAVVSNMETMSMGLVGKWVNRRLTRGSAAHIQIVYADWFTPRKAPLKSWLTEYFPHLLFNSRWLSKWGVRSADANVAVSRYLVERVASLGAQKVVYGPIGADADAFRPSPEARRKYREPLVIGYLGHLTYVKGVSLLIDAFRSIRGEWDARLVMSVTRGSEGDLMRSISDWDDVTIIGPTDAAEFFASCDLYVLPRRAVHGTVNLPNTVLEAMACETAVLTSALPGVTELIDDGDTGFLFAPGDAGRLVEKLRLVAGNPELMQEVGVNARRRVVAEYPWTRISKVVEELVDDRI